jgi:putative peptide zinc metalloprotease protein
MVKDNDVVKPGDTLAILENPEKSEGLLNAERMVFQYAESAKSLIWASDIKKREVAQQEKIAQAYQQQADTIRRDLDRLRLVAHIGGVVMQPPKPEKLGTYLEVGPSPFCQIGDPTRLQAWLVVDQGYIDLVHEGQEVRLKFYGHALKDFDGNISSLPNVDVDRLPPELSNVAGGEVATKSDPQTGQQIPVHTLYYAVVPLKNDNNVLMPGLRGKAKIKADPMPLATRLWRWIKRTFHFEA